MATIDLDILRAVLVGYDHQRKTIEEIVAELKRQLGGRAPKASASPDGATGKRKPLSSVAHKRIAAAQKKRWAAFYAKQKLEAAMPKRKLSAATKKKLVTNLATARAAKAAKAAA